MLDFKKIFKFGKTLILKFENSNSLSFNLQEYTNNIPWVDTKVFTSSTSIYTKNGNRSYINSLSEYQGEYNIDCKTEGFIKINKKYENNSFGFTSDSFSGDGLLGVLTVNSSSIYNKKIITIANVNSARIKLNLEGGVDPRYERSCSFDIYINNIKHKSVSISRSGSNFFHNIENHISLPTGGSETYPTLMIGSDIVHFIPNEKEDLIIEIRNVNSQQLWGIFIDSIEYESNTTDNTTYNDTIVYAKEN